MDISERVQNAGEKYIAPFLTGLASLAVYATADRLKSEAYLDPVTANLEGVLRRSIRAYTFGEIASELAFPLLIIKGGDELLCHDNPSLLGATIVTLLVSNGASLLYEVLRKDL